eukprot:2135508-Amphidinium_carterae.1
MKCLIYLGSSASTSMIARDLFELPDHAGLQVVGGVGDRRHILGRNAVHKCPEQQHLTHSGARSTK